MFVPFQLSLMLGAPLKVRFLASLSNIRLGWIGLPGTNAIAHFQHSCIYIQKKFYKFGPRAPKKKVEKNSTKMVNKFRIKTFFVNISFEAEKPLNNFWQKIIFSK